MIARRLFWFVGVSLLVVPAHAQFATGRAKPPKLAATSPSAGPSGGFLVGTDDCALAHRSAGSGDQFGLPFTTGTTGTAGQNEGACYFFGTSGINADVWFDWTATSTGNGTLSSCAGTTIDTKMAVWPGGSGCPADGTSLACNDDACGLQTTVVWPVSSGSSYLFQIGTFPGASGGSGTFDVFQSAAPSCDEFDDAVTENALGLVNGGEILWMHSGFCTGEIGGVDTAYGSPTAQSPPNGNASRVAVWEDPDCDGDPTTPPAGMTLLHSLSTIVINSGTDIINYYPFPATVLPASGCAWAGVTSDQAAGEFPAPMDETNPTLQAWVVGSTVGPGTLDLSNLNNNSAPPVQMGAIGFPTAFVLNPAYCPRACMKCLWDPTDTRNCKIWSTHPCNGIGTSACFGDGSGGACGCGNNGGSGEGCANSTGAGSILSGSGSPSLSGDTLNLIAIQTPNQPGIFFQGDAAFPNPPTFGDGLRCCGQNTIRIGIYLPAGNATDTATGNLIGGIGAPISQHPGNAGLMPGDDRCYQWWYRDPVGPCSTGFNLSNAWLVTWTL